MVGGEAYARLTVKTHVLTASDDLCGVAKKYAAPRIKAGDILFISEKAVACTQNRAIKMEEIQPRRLAVYLAKFVHKSPYGIGLSIPQTMEMALKECGTVRILFAAALSAVSKIFGIKGVFYLIAGKKAAGIDGPCNCTLPPYDTCVVLAPKNANKAAREVANELKTQVAIVDINDLGGVVLGRSNRRMRRKTIAQILRDNPLGQGHAQTPMGIIRKI